MATPSNCTVLGHGILLRVLSAIELDAAGEDEDIVNFCFPQRWPDDRECRPKIIAEWLRTEALFLA